MLGPLPSLLTAPSIWYAAVLVPKRNPGGNRGTPPGLRVPHGHNLSRGCCDPPGNGPIRGTAARTADRTRVLVRLVVRRRPRAVRSHGLPRRPPAPGRRGVPAARPRRPGDRDLGGLRRPLPRRPERAGARRAGPGGRAPHRRRGDPRRGRGCSADPLRPGLAHPAGPGEPSYAVATPELPTGELVRVAEPEPGAVLSVVRLDGSQTVTIPAAPRTHVYVARGALLRSSLAEPLHEGDAFLFTDEPATTSARACRASCWSGRSADPVRTPGPGRGASRRGWRPPGW